jgi:hypothetical protein
LQVLCGTLWNRKHGSGGITDFIKAADFGSSTPAIRQLKWNELGSLNYIFANLSPDGKTLALANTMTLRLYDSTSLQAVGLPMFGHTDLVTSLAFTPDGSLLASSSQDKTIRLWDTATAQPIGLPLVGHSQWVSSLNISPNGKWLASAGADKTVRIWDISFQDWQSLACQIVRRNLTGEEWQQYLPDEAYHLTCPAGVIPQSGVALISALARKRMNEGKNDEAKAIIQVGLAWILPLNDDITNNTLCWFGSLDGFAAEVLPACERAVSLAPNSRLAGMRDSRGLALALTGKTEEAIPDFQALVDWCHQNGCSDTTGSQREQRIEALKNGQNPFNQ